MKKSRLTMFGTMILMTMGLVLVSVGAGMAADVQLVMIKGVKGDASTPMSLKLEPQELKITKKGVVIWTNGAEMNDVMVIFEDGKACQELVSDPDDKFKLDDQKACFVTTYMPFGATSSLVFTEIGTYQYKVVSEDGKLKTHGSIEVVK